MSSTFVADTPEDASEDNTHVIIIVNDDSGNISEMDQEMLQQLLISQENTTLSVVRVDDKSGENTTDVNLTVFTTPTKKSQADQNSEKNGEVSTDSAGGDSEGIAISRSEDDRNFKESAVTHDSQVNKTGDQQQGLEVPDPLLALDQEEIEKIEHALQSEQARQLLGILGQGTEGEPALDDLLDPDLTGDPEDNEVVATISLDHCYSAVGGVTGQAARRSISSDFEGSEAGVSTSPSGPAKGGTNRGFSPKRRSQRQIDRMELEQLRKIRAENQEMLKKEKQEMVKLTPVKKENVDSNEGEAVSLEATQPQQTPAKKVEGSSGYRITTLRQEVQAKALAFEPTTPTKAKINSAASQHPTVSATARNSLDSTPIASHTLDTDSANSQPVAKSRTDGAVTNSGGTGGVARPRRENRQPPKHLREAFVQLDEEGVISALKSMSKASSEPHPEEQAPVSGPKGKLTKKIHQNENHQPVEAETETDSQDDNNEEEGTHKDEGDQSDSADSWNSEDDPDRLWCLCRKPHNSQFMICCDKCSDWFHGRCVGVSRRMARALEDGGLEWICPKCVQQEQEQGLEPLLPKKEEKVVKAKEGYEKTEAKSPKGAQKTIKVQGKRSSISEKPREFSGTAEAVEPPRKCVVALCKSEARPNSVYCSEACIVTYTREALLLISKEKTKMEKMAESSAPTTPSAGTTKPEPGKLKESVEFGKLMSQATPQASKSKAINQLRKSASLDGAAKPANLTDDTPVPVVERKTGKTLTGPAAPKVGTLEQWLKDNPTFEIVKPSSSPATAKSGPKTPLKSPKQTTPRSNSTNQSNSATSSTPTVASVASRTPTTSTAASPSQSSSTSSSSLHTPKSTAKNLSRSNSAATDSKTGHMRKKSADSSKFDDEKKVPDAESMRCSAKTSLKDVLWNRCKEATDIQVTETEVEHVAEEIEQALFREFKKDVGSKYKTKYRSLFFNIKDTKNQGLFRKIVERQVTPGQLVKMTAEELASKELAEWREREAKHQLEIIQKTEMELMNMSTKYLVKTHKGEEIIEDTVERKKSEEREIVSTANTPGMEISSLQDTTSKHGSHEFDLNCQICRKIKEEEVCPSSGSSHSRDGHGHKDKKKNDKDKDKKSTSSSSSKNHSSSRKDSSSSSRSRDTSSSKSHDKSKEKDRGRDHSKDKERDYGKSKDRSRSKDKDRDHEKPKEKDKKHQKHRSDKKDKDEKDSTSKDSGSESTTVVPNPITDPVISTSSQVGDFSSPTSLKTEPDDVSVPVPSQSQQDLEVEAKKSSAGKEAPVMKEEENVKQEPTSTTSSVSARTPEQDFATKSAEPPIPGCVWKGIVNSSETGKFFVQAIDMKSSGDLSDVEMPGSLDIVGRIRPEMVWDYVNQTRKAGSRDIVVVKFNPGSELSDKKNYAAFLSHMYKCNRYAVVGPISKLIKDFYIVPLPKDSPIPLALSAMSLDIAGLDDVRVSLLLGVVVRAKRKRAADGTFVVKSKLAKTAAGANAATSNGGSRSFTPPLPGTSSSSSPSVNYIPTARSAAKRKETTADHKASDAKRRARSSDSTSTPADPTSTDDGADDAPYSPGQLLESEEADVAAAGPKQIEMALEELNRKIEEEKKQLASLSAASADDGMVIPGLDGSVVIPGLESDSLLPPPDLEMSRFQAAPLTTPPVSSTAAGSTSGGLNQISIPTNLQEILSTIQKKETELKMSVGTMEHKDHVPNRNRFSSDSPMRTDAPSGGNDQDLRSVQDLFPPQDVDMRIAVPLSIPPADDKPATLGRDPRAPASPPRQTGGEKKSLRQLTDAEVVAKAMEQLETPPAVPIAPPQGQPQFFGSPPHNAAMPPMMMPLGPPGPPGPGPIPPFHHPGGGPPMGPVPGPIGPPYHRPVRPPFMGGPPGHHLPGHHQPQQHPSYHSPPPAGGYRPKKKR